MQSEFTLESIDVPKGDGSCFEELGLYEETNPSYQGKSHPSKIQLGRLFLVGKQKLVAATKQAPPEHGENTENTKMSWNHAIHLRGGFKQLPGLKRKIRIQHPRPFWKMPFGGLSREEALRSTWHGWLIKPHAIRQGANPPTQHARYRWRLTSAILNICDLCGAGWGNIPMYDYIFEAENWVAKREAKALHRTSLQATSITTSMVTSFWRRFGGFVRWWYPTTIGFPTKNDHFGVFWGYHLRKHPYGLPFNISDSIAGTNDADFCRVSPSLKHISQNRTKINLPKACETKWMFLTSITVYIWVAGIELLFFGNSRKYSNLPNP